MSKQTLYSAEMNSTLFFFIICAISHPHIFNTFFVFNFVPIISLFFILFYVIYIFYFYYYFLIFILVLITISYFTLPFSYSIFPLPFSFLFLFTILFFSFPLLASIPHSYCFSSLHPLKTIFLSINHFTLFFLLL